MSVYFRRTLIILVLLTVPFAWFLFFVFKLKKVSGVEKLDLNFIKEFETGGQPILTLFINKIDGNLEGGYGHTFSKLLYKAGQKITVEEAERLFNNDVNTAVRVYGNAIDWNSLTANQKRAIISHAYNTGAKSATIIKYANEGNFEYLKTWWPKHYITSNGVVYNGLVRRRQFEANLL